ncbi:reverse transcriptase domain-containing protein [Trichonephila inaurata madagascariensis]|uniref:Reverse transcriptase domain-containing protein n=1 Tax=Trichonephila inaurata madagascariensis TaxID=2747483 RepID=A0A8X6X9W1_9ARAC|nr:reverse transcriptase domain-containing protein [Trichonephila inaurata madagascariensis]
MEILKKWCEENQMIVNTERTVYQLFTLSTKREKHPMPIKCMNLTLLGKIFLDILVSLLTTILERICRGKYEKRQKKDCLLKRLAGVPWGSSPDVLTTKYKSYVRTVLDYGKLLAKASKSGGDKTNKIQNKAFRLLPLPLPILPLKYRQILNPWGLG